MGARNCPLGLPSAFSIELANTFEQAVRGRIQVNRQHRYLLTQFLDGKHGHNYTFVQSSMQQGSAMSPSRVGRIGRRRTSSKLSQPPSRHELHEANRRRSLVKGKLVVASVHDP